MKNKISHKFKKINPQMTENKTTYKNVAILLNITSMKLRMVKKKKKNNHEFHDSLYNIDIQIS